MLSVFEHFRASGYIHTYIYIYLFIYLSRYIYIMYVCIYIYIHTIKFIVCKISREERKEARGYLHSLEFASTHVVHIIRTP